ncbi:MAG: hypothetical protein DWQ01_09605 [Planctomycetota bacterium]|nr:MAG: hypothetical protein DWQ01_09605 [Planctomycetota bacterium]
MTETGDDLPPGRVAARIVAHLNAGETEAANELFEDYASEDRYHQTLYPVLFDAAEEYHDTGRPAEAVSVMRFVVEQYPDGNAAKEALLYSLFLLRAEAGKADRLMLDEMGVLLDELEGEPQNPAWIQLISTQYWIDRDRPREAKRAFEQFESEWNGRPSYLASYVTEIERWLQTNA